MRSRFLIAILLFLPTLGFADPTNDNLANALTISSFPYTNQQSTLGASDEENEKFTGCLDNALGSVWYKYTATGAEVLSLDTFGTDYDTILSVWTGSAHPLTETTCNDDSNPYSQSQLSLTTEAGQTYYINISGFRGAGGNLVFNAKKVSPLSNDNLAEAITINASSFVYDNTQITANATQEAGEVAPSCHPKATGSVWYQYTPTVNQPVVFETKGSDYNTVLSIWTGGQHPLNQVDCNDGFGGTDAKLTLNPTANTTYYINVATGELGKGSSLAQTGLLTLSMSAPPTNDNMDNAVKIEEPLPYTNSQPTSGATTQDGQVQFSCGPTQSDVWYSYTPSRDYNNLTISTIGSSYDTVLSVWEGNTTPTKEMACNDNIIMDSPEAGMQYGQVSQVAVSLTKGQTYFIAIGTSSDEVGDLILKLKESEADFAISSQPLDTATTTGNSASLSVGVTPVGTSLVSSPITYTWYQGESGNTSQVVATNTDNNRLTIDSLTATTSYWVRVSNATGSKDSAAATVTVSGEPITPASNGVGIDTQGNFLQTLANFAGTTTPAASGGITSATTADTISANFVITVDPSHVGQKGSILLVVGTELPPGPYDGGVDTLYSSFDTSNNTVDVNLYTSPDVWMSQLTEPYMKDVTLENTINVTTWQRKLDQVSMNYIFAGYRLEDGTIFYTSQPLIINIAQ